MQKVVVGMSGGVDSAVAAYLLQLAGYEVIGMTIRSWVSEDGKDSRCCEIDDARNVTDQLGIPYYVVNCLSEFTDKVTDPFIDAYIQGRTPNPCVGCNKDIKWAKMMEFAKSMQAEFVATGHYATVKKTEEGRYTVKKATHANKDQTYMLYKLTQEQLAATIMPLGRLSKDEVRNIAQKAGIAVADKPDSQEICFVPTGRYTEYIEENYTGELPGEGDFIDEQGNVLGKHKGIINYTVGQRKGLGIALGKPAFVKKIDPVKNTVMLSTNESLFNTEIVCEDFNFLSIPDIPIGEHIKCYAKIRYHHSPQIAVVERISDKELAIRFEDSVRAATPGQSAVFYDDDDCVIGGGVISGIIA